MRRILLSVAASAAMLLPSLELNAAPQKDIVKEVLNVYNDELRVDPKNYNVLFRRAHLFYGQNQYNQALADIDKAIALIPRNDSDLLCQAYALRANIYLMTDENESALKDLVEACLLDPSSYPLLYQKANTEYLVGKYAEAKDDYRKLGRVHQRSLESLIGLARVAVKENNLGLANEYVDEAVNLYPSESEAYIRRASVRRLLGNMTGAVDDLILALAVDKNNTHAISEIVNISHVDYNAVISALSSAISQAPEVGVYLYIRASIQQAHYHFLAAISDYQSLIDRNIYNYHGIYASLAECFYGLARFDKALDNINRAIGMTADNASYYVVRSRIRLALGDDINAMESAMMAYEKNPQLNSALIEKGMCAIAQRQYGQASDYIGEASLNAPEDARLYIIRGWIIETGLNRSADAMNFYQRGAEATDYPMSISSLKGFALLGLGDKEAAARWVDDALATSPVDVDGRQHFLAACLYAQLGNFDRALVSAETALQRGYASLYDWLFDQTANINIEPLRNDERFDALMKRYSYLF